MKPKIIVLIFLLGVGLSCMFSSEARQAKIYRSELETMRGDKWLHVNQLIKGWDFKVMDSWKAENPNEEWIKKRNPAGVGFSDDEIQTVFALEGKYEVLFFRKKNKSRYASSGSVDSQGQTMGKDDLYSSDTFTIIRTVFRNENFISYKVWGNVGSSSLIEGMKRKYN